VLIEAENFTQKVGDDYDRVRLVDVAIERLLKDFWVFSKASGNAGGNTSGNFNGHLKSPV